MATTTDLATTPRKPSATGRASAAAKDAVDHIEATAREEELEAQIAQLQADLKSITHTLSRLTGTTVEEAKNFASSEIRHLKRRGQHMLDDAQGHAEEYEQQLKDTIREKPLTAVATAAGIGFVLALLTRH